MGAFDFSLVLGIIGNALSILVFSSPLPTFWRIYKRRSTESFKGLPYICTLLSTSLWTYYGLMKPGGTLILTINAAGTAFQSFYLLVFLIFAPKRRKVRTAALALLLDGLGFGIILVATLVTTKASQRVSVVGAICSTISVSMYASPLVALRTVVRTKSVEFMPFFLSLFLFLNGGVWALYALLVKDVFVEIPNAIGFVLGAIQLAVYVYYKNRGQKAAGKKENERTFKVGDTSLQDDELELGRSVSLPKQFPPHDKGGPASSILKHQSLPSKIISTSSAKFVELLNFLQDNDPINSDRPKNEDKLAHDRHGLLLITELQSSPHSFQ